MLTPTHTALATLGTVRALIRKLDVSASPIQTWWDPVLAYDGRVNVRIMICGRDLRNTKRAKYVYVDVRFAPGAAPGLILAHLVRAWARLFQHEAFETLRMHGRPLVPAHHVRDFDMRFDLDRLLGIVGYAC